ncbi:PucR family transcriptional regulator ligand-binding domain-containing protein [Umezawaea sp. Da 62-37]|uniref:PucR family transcriptional regulator n=1 Tax=Umezawaea sp. Da 62-37 TaxID=3075927 RepID=UPI0028F6D10D|nr:PucR family transcriptional regulator ligand-binding domain-containing protein [Umezawaea sp. Da 62-37]WNV88842.1 PucR family transcriptional regulator ligand-binding domain-containing protein [Umezawaea sp. Da 62-37]
MVLVRALLGMPELRLRLRSGGDLLDRPVTRLYGTELPDPARYLSGGELVLSGLLWHREAADCEVFVSSLAHAGVAALAASEVESRELPTALLEACLRHGVPLLEVPVDLSFATITERVVLELAAERVGDAGTMLGRHRRLLTVVAEGLPALVEAGARELGAACSVLSTTGRLVAGVEVDQPAALVRDFLRADRLPKVVRGTTLLPVAERGGGRLTNWILAAAGDKSDDEVAAELASLVALERSRIAQGRVIENRSTGPLLRLVLDGSAGPGELRSRVSAAGFDPDAPLRVLAVSASDRRVDLAAAVLEELVAEIAPRALVGAVGSEVYALAPADVDRPADVARRALRALEPGLDSTRLLVGISSPTGVAGLRGAIEEASHARRLGEARTGRTCVVAGEEIALHQLLLAGVPEELRSSVRRRLLGAVLDYDAEHGTDLVGTLRVFLDGSGSWTTAAAELHVHVNTLRYRIGRVQELLGVDLGDFTTRVDLYLALQVGPGRS